MSKETGRNSLPPDLRLNERHQYDKSYDTIYKFSRKNAEDDIYKMNQFANKYPAYFKADYSRNNMVSNLMSEAEEYDNKVERLQNLQEKYSHPKKEKIQAVIDHFDPLKKSKQRLEQFRNQNYTKKEEIQERTEIQKLIEDYNIQLELKSRLTKEAKEIYPQAKDDASGFLKYKLGIFKRESKRLAIDEEKQREKEHRRSTIANFISQQKAKEARRQQLFQLKFSQDHITEASETTIQFSSGSPTHEVQNSGIRTFNHSPQHHPEPAKYKDKGRNQFNINRNSLIVQKEKYFSQPHYSSDITKEQTTHQSQLFLGSPKQNKMISFLKKNLDKYSPTSNKGQQKEKQKKSKKDTILQKNKEFLQSNKNYLKSVIVACNDVHHPNTGLEVVLQEKQMRQSAFANEIQINHLQRTSELVQNIDYAHDPKKAEQLFNYVYLTDKDQRLDIKESRNDFKKGSIDPTMNSLLNKKKK